jgi:flagellar motor component MotA
MPIALKNEITLLHSLCAVITNTLIGVSNGNLNQLIEEFAKNMKIIADQNKETKYSEQFTMN